MIWLSFVFALAAGAANPFQSGTNAQLNKQLASPLWAGVVVYATGLIGILVLLAVLRPAMPTTVRALAVNPWAWLGGLISIGPTMAGLVLAQRMGSGMFTGLSITAALVTSVVLDQMGVVGFKQHAASPARLAGCALMVAGVWMIARF
jgi:transporter family-2 protein